MNVVTVAALLVALASGPRPGPDDVLRKCDRAGPPVIAIDGEMTDLDPEVDLEKHLPRDEVGWVEIVCDDAGTLTLDTGNPVVSIWTKDGPVSALEPLLDAVLRAQEAHWSEHGRYADELEGLDVSVPDDRIRLTLYPGDGGFLAAAGVERFLGGCYAVVGDVRSPHPRVKHGEAVCLGAHDALGIRQTLMRRER